MLRRSVAPREGSLVDKMIPGWKERLWSKVPPEWQRKKIEFDNAAFERELKTHRNFQVWFLKYKKMEKKFIPSEEFRKPLVDWRRQLARGTLWIGKPQEGPEGTNYTPGNTKDRLRETIPFTAEEWAERKQNRTWDGLKLGITCWGLWVVAREWNDWPVVWV